MAEDSGRFWLRSFDGFLTLKTGELRGVAGAPWWWVLAISASANPRRTMPPSVHPRSWCATWLRGRPQRVQGCIAMTTDILKDCAGTRTCAVTVHTWVQMTDLADEGREATTTCTSGLTVEWSRAREKKSIACVSGFCSLPQPKSDGRHNPPDPCHCSWSANAF